MEFKGLKEEIKSVNLDALRMDCDNNFEAVILKEELNKLIGRLEKFFGAPAWPSKNMLPFRAQEAIKNFGGILPGQTLYFYNQGNDTIYAMLWPWKDGKRTTLKIIKQR